MFGFNSDSTKTHSEFRVTKKNKNIFKQIIIKKYLPLWLKRKMLRIEMFLNRKSFNTRLTLCTVRLIFKWIIHTDILVVIIFSKSRGVCSTCARRYRLALFAVVVFRTYVVVRSSITQSAMCWSVEGLEAKFKLNQARIQRGVKGAFPHP